MFAEAGENPFAEQPQAYTKRSTVDRMTELHEAGVPARAIAKEVGVSLATVKRHVARRVTSRNAQR
ncbi:helix-turn-helix domain-containing protein [Rubinisphaera brasiliensis]|uniref:helix-turn-helix domain-containing protein n=1 Tax=Rubinisphaera brasiliensis TaxID=119 RepID=UPI0036F2EF9E